MTAKRFEQGKMMVIVVGTGKLARELLSTLPRLLHTQIIGWSEAIPVEGSAIVVHAGSGRELENAIGYCKATGSTLVELATGSEIENYVLDFPVVLCPNTNVLMLKFMAMLASAGHHFKNYKISIVESHQADKSSVPGTAVSIAESLGLPASEVVSIRDPQMQQESLHIPAEYLSRHAYHRIEIEDQVGSLVLETKICGPAPYAEGLAQIISAISANQLERRRYSVMELIENGWI